MATTPIPHAVCDSILDSGFLEFKLDYSKTTDLAIGRAVCSKNVSAGDHIWRVRCYPRGIVRGAGNSGYLSLFLQLVSESKNVKAIFDAFVMGKDGKPSSSHAKRCVQVYPHDGFDNWGWPQFARRSDLESLYMVNGVVRFIFGVILVRDDEPSIAVPPSDVGNHLGRLLDRADETDVSFVVDGETFHAHRAVLAARSPVFRAQLFGSMAEATMSCITLCDIEPATFRVLLRFLYTDVLPGDEELVDVGSSTTELFQNLLAAADGYDLGRLKLMCAQKLWETVSVDTVATTLGCADMHNCPELKKMCLDFFIAEKNFKRAVLTEGFVRLVQKFPSIIFELREGVGTA